MRSYRPPLLAAGAFAVIGTAGCRTSGFRDAERAREATPLARQTESAANLFAEHNRNADKITSLEAQPTITVNRGNAVNGRLAFERPKNFKLYLSTLATGAEGDLGSNDREYWFWIRRTEEKAIYYCNYDENGESPLASSLQPDWIVEALGLRAISEEEARQTRVGPGPEPGTYLLSRQTRGARGQTYLKETILNATTRRIRQQNLYTADRGELLARALIPEYEDHTEYAENGQPLNKVYFPKRAQLEWRKEQVLLDVTIKSVEINPDLSARRAALFVEPTRSGYARVNLIDRAGLAQSTEDGTEIKAGERTLANSSRLIPPARDRATVRQSMPAPPPRVRLNAPTPLGMQDQGRSWRTNLLDNVVGDRSTGIGNDSISLANGSLTQAYRFEAGTEK